MAAEVRDLDTLDKIIADDPSGLASFKTLQVVARAVRRNTPIQGANIKLTPRPDGVIIDAGAEDLGGYPLQCYVGADDDGDGTKMSVLDATVGDMTPTIGGVTIDTIPAPQLTVSPGDRIFLEIEVEPGAENLGDDDHPYYRVAGGSLVAVAIVDGPGTTIDASVSTSDGTPTNGMYYRRITTWTGVALDTQPLMSSLDWAICAGPTDSGQSIAKFSLGV